ncbi:MAG: tetratricopeptide repeat protein [Candidatus Hydrogenedentes bacterium]|nr:tetratricopeptide repeat protein [Candidatus Hydrogenedentota bacterium]
MCTHAMAAFDTALRIGEGGKETLNNLGSVCAEYGQLEAAERYYTQALEADPDYGTSLRNLGKVYVQTGRHREALPLFERLLKQDPLEPEANWLAFTCLKEQGRIDEAIAQLERMDTFPGDYSEAKSPASPGITRLSVIPRDKARIYRELGMIYFNDKRQPAMAHRYFARSLSIDPNQPELQRLIADLQAGGSPMDDPNAPLMPSDLMPGLPGVPPSIPTPDIPKPGIDVPAVP